MTYTLDIDVDGSAGAHTSVIRFGNHSLPVLNPLYDLEAHGINNAVPNEDGGANTLQEAWELWKDNPGAWFAIWLMNGVHFKMTESWEILDPAGFCTARVLGQPYQFDADPAQPFAGPTVELVGARGLDSGVLVFQGTRAPLFDGVRFKGGNTQPNANFAGGVNAAILGCPTRAEWVASGVRTNRFSPQAGVVIDPYMSEYPGGDAGNCYPGKTEYYGGTALPNPVSSSAPHFRGCVFTHNFGARVMSPPGPGASGNDLVANNENAIFEACTSTYNTYHYMSGQSQERGNVLRSDRGYGAWCGIDNEYVGPGGNAGVAPYIQDFNYGGMRYAFNLNTTQQFSIGPGHIESTASLGKLGTGAASSPASCRLDTVNVQLASSFGQGDNYPEVEYALSTFRVVELEHVAISAEGATMPVNNNDGRLMLTAFNVVDDGQNGKVQVGFAYPDYRVDSRTVSTKYQGSLRHHRDPIYAGGQIAVGDVDNGSATLEIAQDETNLGRGTVTLSSAERAAELDTGDLLVISPHGPNTFVPQILSPDQFAYTSIAPCMRVRTVVGAVVHLECIAFGVPFDVPVRLSWQRWDNSPANN